jgi:hypothetical protein
MERILEVLLARMDADKAELKAERKADHEEMMAGLKSLNVTLSAWLEKTHACLEESKEAAPEETEVVAEPQEVLDGEMEVEEEPTPEETEVVVESREVPKGGTDEETSEGTEDQTGEQRLAMRRHRQQKKRAQVNGGPQQKSAAARRRFTRRVVPVMRKGHIRRGPGKRCRHNGVRGPGKISGIRMGGQSPKQWQIQDVVRETPGQTYKKRRRMRPECNSSIWRLSKTPGNRRGKRTEKRHLERMKADREIIRRSLRLEIAKLMIMSFIGL